MDEMKMQVENQDCDLIVVFPKDFEQAVAAYDSMTAQTPHRRLKFIIIPQRPNRQAVTA